METNDEVNVAELLKGSVDDFETKAGSLTRADLVQAHELEENGQKRVTLLAAIDKAMKALPNAPAEGDAEDKPAMFTQEQLDEALAEREAKHAADMEAAEKLLGEANEGHRAEMEKAERLFGEQGEAHKTALADLEAKHAEEIAKLQGDGAAARFTQEQVDGLLAQQKQAHDAEVQRLTAKIPAKAAKTSPAKPLALPKDAPADFATRALTSREGVLVAFTDQDDVLIRLEPMAFLASQLQPNGPLVKLNTDIEFPKGMPGTEIAGAFLLIDGKPVAKAGLVQPVAIGGGKPTKLPAGTLAFGQG